MGMVGNSNDHFIDAFDLSGSIIDMLYHGLAIDESQGLTREASGFVAGGDDDYCFH